MNGTSSARPASDLGPKKSQHALHYRILVKGTHGCGGAWRLPSVLVRDRFNDWNSGCMDLQAGAAGGAVSKTNPLNSISTS